MFQIQYNVLKDNLGSIDHITEEEICYDIMLGDVHLYSPEVTISISWGWVPLLDFANCFHRIVKSLKDNEAGSEVFEFTENGETLTFTRQDDTITVVPSFSLLIIEATFSDFESAVEIFNSSISKCVYSRIEGTPSTALVKFLRP